MMTNLESSGSFGDWLKARRKALDLTQEELSARAGCSVFALRKIESGERRPSKQLAGLLAAALEIPEEDRMTFIRVARGDLIADRLHTSQPGSKPASPSPQPASHHLPLPSTPLLGRDPELAAMDRIFNEPPCRLLTLTGMGGIGKTRLAIEFASRQEGRFPDGVHYVPLASINSAELIIPAVAEALDFSFSGPADLQEQLFNFLAQIIKQPALLVLDNLEHLLAQSSAAAELVSEILQHFSNIKILCTSRERLNLHGEWTYELHGLPIPPYEFLDKLEEYSAAELFLQRARQIHAEFELTEADRPALVQICQLLEGIPLAIELAAAWTGMLSCREIAQEIERNIDFLTTSMRDIPERHRSLKATFDHSWRLLSDEERDAMSRLAVFHGGFDRLAAEKVAGATLPLLASLVSKSLVRRTEDGRYDLHEVIRQYALSHLEEDAQKNLETCDAHSSYYLNFAAEREMALKSGHQRYAVQEILGEMDNLRAAWLWMFQRETFEEGCKAIRSLGWFFEVSGLIHEGIDHFEPLVRTLKARPASPAFQRVLGEACTQQGILCFRKGLYERAVSLMEESVSLLRPLGDTGLLVDALVYLGIIMHLNGEMDRSQALMEEGLSYAQDPKYEWFAAYAIYNLGYITSLRGNYIQGREQMMEGLTIWRRLGDPHSIALGLNYLVPTLIALGCYDEARTYLLESLELCQASNNRWGKGTAYRHLGWVAKAQGNLEEAQSFLHKSLNTFGDYIIGWDISQTLIVLGETIALTGDCLKAENLLLTALRLARDIHSTPLILESLTGLASLEMRLDPERATGWLMLIKDHPAAKQDVKDRACQLTREAEVLLSVEQMQRIREEGSKRSLETIAAELVRS
jgi:predicted ATPase/DNA-binding XRE family transcriptional regulator